MYKHILVPVDGSATSDRGLEEAIQVARLAGAQLRLVHVMEDPVYTTEMSGFGAYTKDFMAVIRMAGDRLLDERVARARAGDIEADGVLLERKAGRLCDVVIDAATAWGADLIVLGTHGRRGIGRVLMGSDAEQILRLAPTPVLLVRSVEAAR